MLTLRKCLDRIVAPFDEGITGMIDLGGGTGYEILMLTPRRRLRSRGLGSSSLRCTMYGFA